jgi:hypothetical protein
MLLPILLVHINGTLGTIVDTNRGFFATDRTCHALLPTSSLFPVSEELVSFPLSFRESVT